jgi:hypothetical protein
LETSLYENSNDNRVRVVNFATSKNLIVKSSFPISKHSYIKLNNLPEVCSYFYLILATIIDGVHLCSMYDLFQRDGGDTGHRVLVAEVRERLSVGKLERPCKEIP